MKSLAGYKAVILAGGKGTRLYPVTKEIPKPLLPVRGKPIVNYLVDLFYAYGIKEVAMLVSGDFREEFEWWKKRHYPLTGSKCGSRIVFFEEKEPLGTFGGLHFLKDWIGDKEFFLTNGDELKQIDLGQMAEFHKKRQPIGTIALAKVPNPQDYGVVVCNSDKVLEFLEKPANPPSNYINSGLYLLSPEIFQYHEGPKFTMIEKDIFPRLAKEQKLLAFKFRGRWMDCGTWERYEKALTEWK